MKQFILTVITLLYFSACKNNNYNFSLTGEISGLKSDTLYIYNPEGSENDLDTIVVKDGSFKYMSKVDTVTSLTLLIDNILEFPIFADKDLDVEIEGGISNLQIKGGILNDELNKFRNSISSSKTSGKKEEKLADEFIRTHPDSPVSIYVLNKYFAQSKNPDYHKIGELIKLLSTSLQDDSFIKQLSDMVELQMNTEVGKFAPSFSNKDQKGKSITFSDFKDKYILMTFWASWWKPYIADQKMIKGIVNKYKKKDLALLGISLDVNRKNWLQAIEKDTLSGMQVTDLKGWDNSIVKQYGIEKLPSNILIGPDRKIIARDLSESDLKNKLEEIFK